MFSSVANDANHHVCHLVIGYVAGNETAESWKIALDFAKQNLPSFDVAHQVLLTDGSKGAADAMSTFDHAHHFLCSNHRHENAKKFGKDPAMLYNQCVQATSMLELQSLLSVCDGKLQGFIKKHALHMQFPIALLETHRISLHGVTTTNSVESVNNAALLSRQANSEFNLITGLVEMMHKHYYSHKEKCWSTKSTLPPTVARKINALGEAATKNRGHAPGWIKAIGNHTYNMLARHTTTGYVTTNLATESLDKMCCAAPRLKQFPCIHIVSAMLFEGADVASTCDDVSPPHVHPSDTKAAWQRQYPESTKFELPQQDDNVLASAHQAHDSSLLLTPFDDEHQHVLCAPFIPIPAGRPTNKRKQAFKKSKQPTEQCSKCGFWGYHNAATCKGRSEMPAALVCKPVTVPAAQTTMTMAAFTYEEQEKFCCAVHSCNNLLVCEWVQVESLKAIADEAGRPESGDAAPGFSITTVKEMFQYTGLTVIEKAHGQSGPGALPTSNPHLKWDDVIGVNGILMCGNSHWTCLATVESEPPRWRFIDSQGPTPFTCGPTIYDIDCSARLHDFMSTCIAKNPSTAVLSFYGRAKRGMHPEYATSSYAQRLWLRPVEETLLEPFYEELNSIADAYAEDLAPFFKGTDPKQFDMSFLFDATVDVKTGLADFVESLYELKTSGATMLRSLFRDLNTALQEFHDDEMPIHHLKKAKPNAAQPKAQCPQLDADKMHEECHFGKTEFNQQWAKFVQLKACQMGRAESNVGLYTKQPAINELINAIGMHTMEALMAGGDEATKEKAMECAQGRSLGRYAKAALNVALSEGSIEAS